MKFTLKDYQDDAVRDLLQQLAWSREDWHGRGIRSSVALSAMTGAGKTVMAAAVIETLFYGDPDRGIEADPGAVVLWFTDDPSLNEQTRHRLRETSGDRLPDSRVRVIGSTFAEEKLAPQTVYFLNAQKLSRNALLVKDYGSEPEDGALIPRAAVPDNRVRTFWEILANTIEDPSLTLYLVLDEAHRGMRVPTRTQANERSSIVRQLINGEAGAPPVPIVWGISATIDRFTAAMDGTRGRTRRDDVQVDPARIQESGLIKDRIRLSFPDERGEFDTVLLRRAVREIKESTAAWAAYAAEQGADATVIPLLVVQVPNTPSTDLLLSAISTIRDEWPELPPGSIANVFGDHADLAIGDTLVPYVPPESVQERTAVRVLLAKDAISTGWDCPRAEVLVSYRPASDRTHITQLLGRMVRTPLARRIPGDERLNTVTCILPRFDLDAARAVADVLMGRGPGSEEPPPGPEVLILPVDVTVNPAVAAEVWEAFDALPSQSVPRGATRPVRRLLALAQELSRDGIRENAYAEAVGLLIDLLRGRAVQHDQDVEAARRSILEVEGRTLVAARGPLGAPATAQETFREVGDLRTVDAEYIRARAAFTPEVAKQFVDRVARAASPDDPADALLDARLTAAALASLPAVSEALDAEAEQITRQWTDATRTEVRGTSDARQAVYARILEMAGAPEQVQLRRPEHWIVEGAGPDGRPGQTRPKHLLADHTGAFPIASLLVDELAVIDAEAGRNDFVAWYRNPARSTEHGLAIAYLRADGSWRRLFPDFVIFSRIRGEVLPSIIDPHGTFLGDALVKLRGLADYAETHGAAFHRIEAVDRADGSLRVLDLTSEAVRRAVRDVDAEPTELYRRVGTEYH